MIEYWRCRAVNDAMVVADVVLRDVAGGNRAGSEHDRDARFLGEFGAIMVYVPSVLALRPRCDLGLTRWQTAHHRGIVRNRR